MPTLMTDTPLAVGDSRWLGDGGEVAVPRRPLNDQQAPGKEQVGLRYIQESLQELIVRGVELRGSWASEVSPSAVHEGHIAKTDFGRDVRTVAH